MDILTINTENAHTIKSKSGRLLNNIYDYSKKIKGSGNIFDSFIRLLHDECKKEYEVILDDPQIYVDMTYEFLHTLYVKNDFNLLEKYCNYLFGSQIKIIKLELISFKGKYFTIDLGKKEFYKETQN